MKEKKKYLYSAVTRKQMGADLNNISVVLQVKL